MSLATIAQDVSPRQLDLFARLIYERIGVSISPQKVTLLSNRLRRRLRQRGLSCYDEYYRLLSKLPPSDAEWENFLQEVTTHETYLFRDSNHWDWLRNDFIPDLIGQHRAGLRPARVRVWSAACSTGDEATTVASCFADRLLPAGPWKVEILGTDVGAGAVRQARTLTFGDRSMRHVPESYVRRFFTPTGAGSHVAKSVLCDMLRFEVHNLLEPLREAPFDLVIVKNVLIYFDASSKRKVLANVRRALTPGGRLITGPADGAAEFLTDFLSMHGWLHRVKEQT